jgi:hypothetical protein
VESAVAEWVELMIVAALGMVTSKHPETVGVQIT